MKSRTLSFLCLFACVVTVGLSLMESRSDADEKKAAALVYELRTYTTAEGRLPALHKRFRDHTMKIFEKHGMKNVIYWTPADKKNTLVYVISHKSMKAADDSWGAFRKDPEWQKVFKASRADGPIVTKVEKQFLSATDYSPMK